MLPLNALALVLRLFLLQDQLNEQLLKLFVAIVDAELLKAEKGEPHTKSQEPPYTPPRGKWNPCPEQAQNIQRQLAPLESNLNCSCNPCPFRCNSGIYRNELI